jgi:hypothetical protein
MSDETELNLREQLARIDQLLADRDHKRLGLDQLRIEIERCPQEIRFAPWQLMIAGMTSGAAFLAAGFALAKLLT